MSGTSYTSATAALGLTSTDLTFDDEFDTFTSSPNGYVGWGTSMPYSGSAARYGGLSPDYFSDSSVGVNPFSDQNGVLTITAATSSTPLPDGATYTSGLIQSRYLTSQLYGYYEIGLNSPVPTGLWTSFYLLPTNNTYGAEIDAAEILSKNNHEIYNNTHGIASTGATVVNEQIAQTPNLAAGYHTIGVDWEPNEITWYVDGVVTSVEQTPFGFNVPMYIIAALAAGGNFPGSPDAGFTSAGMNIDYIRAYATANTVDVSGSNVIETASLAGSVLLDSGASNTSAVSITVSLVNASSQIIATAVTDANGYFIFTELAAGSYRILYGAPSGDAPASGSLADSITGLSAVTSLTDGASVLLAPETLAPATLSTVTGTVLYATAAGAAGAAQSGVVVTLENTSGVVVDSTVTDSAGNFAFANLAANNYTVVYTPLAYDAFQVGGAAGASGTTAVFTTTASVITTLAPETLAPAPSEISGTVVYSGSHSEGWIGTGEANVTVSVLNASYTVLATTTTASDGTYSFTGLTAGTDYVQVTPPSGQVIGDGFGTDVTTGRTAKINAVAARGTVAPTVTLLDSPAPSISGSVLFSSPGGTAAANPNVTVSLLNRTDTLVLATTMTGSDGSFSFINMEPGAYYLSYAAPSGETFQSGGPVNTSGVASVTLARATPLTVAPVTLIGTPGSVSGTVLYSATSTVGTADPGIVVDLINLNGTTAQSATTDANGNYSFLNVVPSTYGLLFVVPSGQKVEAGGPAYNTGYTASFSIASGETLSEPAETLIPLPGVVSGSVTYANNGQAGVTVSLIETNGSIFATTTTSNTGAFSFRFVPPGPYQLLYTAPSGKMLAAGGPADTGSGLTGPVTVLPNQTIYVATETLVPTSALATITGSTLLGTAAQTGVAVTLLSSSDSPVATTTTDANGAFSFTNLAAGTYQVMYAAPSGEVLQSGPGGTTGLTGPLTVAAGQTLALAAETLAPAPGTIIGSAVFAGAGQQGITITLLNTAGTTATTTTDANGAFSFANLAVGTYQVMYAAPSGEVLQSGPGGATGLTNALTVAAGQTLTLAAETLSPAPGTITGSAVFAGAGQQGITITLLNTTGTVATTTTDTNGAFSFANLAPGAYQVMYTAPSGELLQSGPGSTSTGLTSALTLAAGQTLTLGVETLSPSTGTVIGSTRLGSAAVAGITAELVKGTTVIATTTSNTSGIFGFHGITPGYYQVEYLTPVGDVIQSGPASPATGLTSAFGVTAGVTRTVGPVTFAPGNGTLTGSVLFAGAGQPGVAVSLLDSGGNVIAETASDSNGAFSFAQLAAGSYALAYTAPAGEVFQAGDPANTTTGVTGLLTLAAGQTLTAAPEHLLLSLTPVSLVMNGKNQTLTEGNAPFIVTGAPTGSTLTLGNADQNVNLGGFYDTVTLGNGNDTVTLTGPGQILSVGDGSQMLTLTGNFNSVTLGNTPTGQTSTVAVNGSIETITGGNGNGNGNVALTGPTGSSTVILGNGNDTVTLTGSHNTITVGTGTSVINAGTNNAVVYAAGGNVSVTVAGQSNLVDIGPGAGVINAGASSRLDTFMLNGINQGLTVINGFNASSGDVLDLARTLAGTGVNTTLSNIGNYVTASVSNGNTTLLVDPTGGSATPGAFAVLNNTTITVSQLVAAHLIKII